MHLKRCRARLTSITVPEFKEGGSSGLSRIDTHTHVRVHGLAFFCIACLFFSFGSTLNEMHNDAYAYIHAWIDTKVGLPLDSTT